MSYFDPYILAKMRKMSYFDPYFSSKLGKMYSFDPLFDPCSVSSRGAVRSIPIRTPPPGPYTKRYIAIMSVQHQVLCDFKNYTVLFLSAHILILLGFYPAPEWVLPRHDGDYPSPISVEVDASAPVCTHTFAAVRFLWLSVIRDSLDAVLSTDAASTNMASARLVQGVRQVKPILSLDRTEARRRVLNLYKAWYRQIPYISEFCFHQWSSVVILTRNEIADNLAVPTRFLSSRLTVDNDSCSGVGDRLNEL